MDSINRQQPEENRKDLTGKEAVDKIKEIVDKSPTCFFCTNVRSGRSFSTRPMAVQQVDDEGNFWFLSAEDSHKNDDLEENPFVRLLFQGTPHSDFLSIKGKATISKDKEKIKELWEPIVKTWFTEGKDDPRITVIKVATEEGYYWDTKHGNMIAFAKQLVGAVTGQTLDDSIEGRIDL